MQVSFCMSSMECGAASPSIDSIASSLHRASFSVHAFLVFFFFVQFCIVVWTLLKSLVTRKRRMDYIVEPFRPDVFSYIKRLQDYDLKAIS